MSSQSSERRYVTPLEGEEIPEIIRGIDLRYLLKKIEAGEKLTEYQTKVVVEDTRYRIAQNLPVAPYGAAHALNILPDEDPLHGALKRSPHVTKPAEEQKHPRPRGPRLESTVEAAQPRMSVDHCLREIMQALRQGSYDFAVSRAEDALKLFTKTPQIMYIAAMAYAHSAAKNVTAEVVDRIADHKRSIEFFDQCLQMCENIPGYAELEANARKKRTEILPMSEQLEKLKRKREEKK